MAYTFQGIGTTFIGKRDFSSDSSYVTTEWITLLYVPIFPIRSMRVIQTWREDRTQFFLFFWSQRDSYRILTRTGPNWRQVLYVYVFAVLYISWIVSYLAHSTDIEKAIGHDAGVILCFVALALPLPIPFLMRHYAKRKARA